MTKKSARVNNTLTTAQIAEAAALFRAGQQTIGELAAKYHCSTKTLSRHFKKMGVKKGEIGEEVQRQVEEELKRQIGGMTADKIKMIQDAKSQSYKLASFVERWIGKLLMEAAHGSKSVVEIKEQLKVLSSLGAPLKNLQNVKFDSLGILNEGIANQEIIPELIIQVMGPDDVKRVQQAQRLSLEDMGDDTLGLPKLDDESDSVIEEPEAPTKP